MSVYQISGFRSGLINSTLSNKTSQASEFNDLRGLSLLLNLDTSQANGEFLEKFRALKEKYSVVNDLCQPRHRLFGLAYGLRGESYRAERYKSILTQLKYVYNKKLNNGYFSADNNKEKQSVCQKLEEMKKDYLSKVYQVDSSNNSNILLEEDGKIFDEICIFNRNLEFEPAKPKLICMATKKDTDISLWYEFIKIYPRFSCLNNNNQSSEKLFNIECASMISLKKQALQILGLDGEVNLFSDNMLTHSVGKAIKLLLENRAATRITAVWKGSRVRKDQAEAPQDFRPGYKRFQYKRGADTTIYIRSPSSAMFIVPEKTVQWGAEGTFKLSTHFKRKTDPVGPAKNKKPSYFMTSPVLGNVEQKTDVFNKPQSGFSQENMSIKRDTFKRGISCKYIDLTLPNGSKKALELKVALKPGEVKYLLERLDLANWKIDILNLTESELHSFEWHELFNALKDRCSLNRILQLKELRLKDCNLQKEHIKFIANELSDYITIHVTDTEEMLEEVVGAMHEQAVDILKKAFQLQESSNAKN